jgi:oligopeptide/dipeptide ABC transporter ATP-binding protein
MRPADLRRHRRQYQIIFQDPAAALDPRMTIIKSVREPLDAVGEGSVAERDALALEMMERAGLGPGFAKLYPHQLSGGQKQRACIARVLTLRPSLIVCDEAVAALDVSIQAQVLNLLKALQRELGLTYVFVAHNMGVVEHISDRVAVMYLGRIAEIAARTELFRQQEHPYTVALMSAIPVPDPEVRRQRVILTGDVPSPVNPPSGCTFHPRCPLRASLGDPDICVTSEPALEDVGGGHLAACHFRGPSAPEHVAATSTAEAIAAG